MGVPKFYRWISERYPCLSEVVKEHQVGDRVDAVGVADSRDVSLASSASSASLATEGRGTFPLGAPLLFILFSLSLPHSPQKTWFVARYAY